VGKVTIRNTGLVTSITVGESGVYRHESEKSEQNLNVPEYVYEVEEVEDDPQIQAANTKDLKRRRLK
jgi:hypothetical protein